MSVVEGVAEFFASSQSWWGQDGIVIRVADHIWLSTVAIAAAVIVALPLAVWLGHRRVGGFVAVAVANLGRAIPSFGIVALALPISLRLGLGLGFWPTMVALVALAIPPIFANGFIAVREVSPAAVEAALGMGMNDWQILRQTEIPLAMPVIWSAMRVASVQVIATATLGAVVGGGGLGRYIIDGFAQGNDVMILVGGILVAMLAVGTDLAFSVGERWVLPKGTSPNRDTEFVNT